jgi:DNA-binding MarR family transcriptional regulator
MGSTTTKDSLAFLLISGTRMLNAAFERRIADAGLGLTPGEARALLAIAAIDGSKQSDIAARLGIEPMTICAYLDKLQSLDLIERKPDPQDRRSNRVMLTETSQTMLHAVREELEALHKQATQGMSTRQVEAFRQLLETLHKNLQPEQPANGGQ